MTSRWRLLRFNMCSRILNTTKQQNVMYCVKDLKICDHDSHLQDKLNQYSLSPSLPLPMELENAINRFIFRVI